MRAQASSSVSRAAAWAVVSSFSMKPAGSVHMPVARLDGAPAQQDAVLPLGQRADHQLGVLVVDGAALLADMAGKAVPGRDAEGDGGAAVRAVFHGRGQEFSANSSPL